MLETNHKVAIFADLHMGVRLDSPDWHQVAKQWVIWFKQELKQRNISKVIFLGDTFHNRSDISVNTLQSTVDVFQQLKEFEIYLVIGNHDAYEKFSTDINSVSFFNEWPNIHVIKNTSPVFIYNKKCTFINWHADVSNIEECNYIFGHLELHGFKMNNSKICEKGTNIKDLLDKANFVFSGHFHHRSEKIFDNKRIIYVGNPFEMDFSDINNEKGFYILDFNTDVYEFIENPVSPKHIIVFSSKYDESFSLTNKIVKLIIDKKTSPEDIDTLIKKINIQNPFQFSIEYLFDQNQINLNEVELDLSGVDRFKAIEEFISLLEIENKNELIKLCQEIYTDNI